MSARLARCIAIAAVLATTAPAHAAGVNLFWDDCSLGPSARTHRSFACDTNEGLHRLVVSFDPPAGLNAVSGVQVILDVVSESCPLPPWWRFKNTGTCRQVSLSASAHFTEESCVDPWQYGANAVVAGYVIAPGQDWRRARLGASAGLTGSHTVALTPGTEYYALELILNNAKTTGAGACDGCGDKVCIELQELKVLQPYGAPGGSPNIHPSTHNLNVAEWQVRSPGPWFQCGMSLPGCTTPIVNRTWGSIKGLYR